MHSSAPKRTCPHRIVLAQPSRIYIRPGVTFNLAQVAADSSADPSPAGASPKRQYLIAPRIGRSASPQIWSALEEAALLMPGQLQAQRGFPGPLRSSLLFLVGNNRRIGPRSSGLLPQARIGRRAAPIGLMPQPRVGRRSGEDMSSQAGEEVSPGSLSDSSLVDAIESMLES